MNHAEAAYFDGNYCQHVADREEWLRLRRIEKRDRLAITYGSRRYGV